MAWIDEHDLARERPWEALIDAAAAGRQLTGDELGLLDEEAVRRPGLLLARRALQGRPLAAPLAGLPGAACAARSAGERCSDRSSG
jgi:hypothetical protein